MTAKKRFKRHVRDRARKTGESYTAALAHARRRPEQERAMSEQTTDPAPVAPAPIVVVAGPAGVGKSTVSHLVAVAFESSVHVRSDDLLASIVQGWVDPSLPQAEHQNEAVGGALAVTALGFAGHGYTTLVDGTLFPEGVAGLGEACRRRDLPLHYVVLSADLATCWSRAVDREAGRWPLEREPFEALHARYARAGVPERHVVDATAAPDDVAAAVLAGIGVGRFLVTDPS